MKTLRERLMRDRGSAGGGKPPLAVSRELFKFSSAVLKHSVLGLPLRLGRALLFDSALEAPLAESRFFDLVGENALSLFDELGPIYGKAGQIALSRLAPPLHDVAEALRLTRLYKDWPPLPFAAVERLLDAEIPRWRTELTLEARPLGVASIAQVHAATAADGREWVVKIIKPHAARRLGETADAMEALIARASPIAVTLASRRYLRELGDLVKGFRGELDLEKERETILRVTERLKGRRQKVLVIPAVLASLSTKNVLVVERFRGVSLADIAAGHEPLKPAVRQKLARSMLTELLVQVFELGLFHGDPHAGNLILLESGAVGLFDWGLAGELSDTDRRHIASILKAVIALDIEQLIDALLGMAAESGAEVLRADVKKELADVIKLVKRGGSDGVKKPSLQELFEACLNAAARLEIGVPDGLLLMVKSLITIEGLARGIDPDVSLARVAAPVLFKAARPGMKDFMALGRRLPDLARQFLSNM